MAETKNAPKKADVFPDLDFAKLAQGAADYYIQTMTEMYTAAGLTYEDQVPPKFARWYFEIAIREEHQTYKNCPLCSKHISHFTCGRCAEAMLGYYARAIAALFSVDAASRPGDPLEELKWCSMYERTRRAEIIEERVRHGLPPLDALESDPMMQHLKLITEEAHLKVPRGEQDRIESLPDVPPGIVLDCVSIDRLRYVLHRINQCVHPEDHAKLKKLLSEGELMEDHVRFDTIGQVSIILFQQVWSNGELVLEASRIPPSARQVGRWFMTYCRCKRGGKYVPFRSGKDFVRENPPEISDRVVILRDKVLK